MEMFNEEKMDILQIVSEKIPYYRLFKQPLILVKGREASVSLDGANVFPSQIEEIIEASPWFNSFKLSKKEFEDGTVRFVVYLELKKDKKLSQEEIEKLKKEYHQKILDHLLKVNYDFKKSYQDNPTLCDPQIVIRQFGEAEFVLPKSGKPKQII